MLPFWSLITWLLPEHFIGRKAIWLFRVITFLCLFRWTHKLTESYGGKQRLFNSGKSFMRVKSTLSTFITFTSRNTTPPSGNPLKPNVNTGRANGTRNSTNGGQAVSSHWCWFVVHRSLISITNHLWSPHSLANVSPQIIFLLVTRLFPSDRILARFARVVEPGNDVGLCGGGNLLGGM